MRIMNTRIVNEQLKVRTNEITVGATYFLSAFNDTDGAMVKVTAKSTKKNSAGWNSSVEYVVVKKIGDTYTSGHSDPGKTGTANASNLYENREDASPKVKFNRKGNTK